MNHAFKSIWNETTGTFVAVAENVNAKGKRSSSARKGGILAAAGALVFGAGSVMALEVPAGESLTFADPSGIINLGTAGSITGLQDLTISGALNAASITTTGALSAGQITTAGDLSADNITASGTLSGGQIATAGNVVAGGDVTATNIAASGTLSGAQITTAGQVTVGSDATLAAGNKQVVTGGQLFTTNKAVSDNKTATDTAINTINTSLTTLGVDAATPGVKYFRANSAEPDAEAAGVDSVAIGPNAKSEGANSLAAGMSAKTNGENSVAVGNEASAEGKHSFAAGNKASTKGESNIALGDEALVDDENIIGAVAIGKGAAVKGQYSSGAVALGQDAEAAAGNATALGTGARALGAGGIALGGATAGGNASLAAGVGARAWTKDSIVLGTKAGVGTGSEVNDPQQRHSHIIIGKNAGNNIDANEAIAIGVGAGSNTSKSQQIAIGSAAGTHIDGERNVSLGYKANSYDSSQAINHATALGSMTKAMTNAVAVGYNANATTDAVAIGSGAKAEDGSIALGSNSHAVQLSGPGYLTGKAFTGSTVSVGNAETGLTRRITNVEDGATGYDAVNVRQLEKLKDQLGSFTPGSGGNVNYNPNGTVSVGAGEAGGDAVNLAQMNTAIDDGKAKYISINPNGDNANEDGSGALGADSANSMAVGHAAKVESAERATAVGYRVLAKAADATVLGSGSTVDDASGVAIGHKAYSRGENSLAFGTDAETEPQAIGASSDNAIAIGTSSRASNNDATAMGHRATASGEKSSALGYFANASATSAMAFGTNSAASGTNSQASGTRAAASAVDSQASGTDAKAFAGSGIAMGQGARSGEANPEPNDAANNRDSIAIGSESVAEMNSSIALGRQAQATANYAQAFGKSAKAFAEESIAQGRNAIALEEKAVAIGSDAKALHKGSVALGSGAVTADAVGTSNAVIDKKTYSYAGIKPVATVSLGSKDNERTLTNLAAGRVSAESTDGINGSQLYGTNMAVEALADDLDTAGGSVAAALGGTSKYDPTTHTVTAGLSVQGNNYNNVQDALTYVGQGWDVSAQGEATENVKPGGKVDFSNTDDNIEITRKGTDLEFALADDVKVGNSITVGDTFIDNSGLVIKDGPSITNVGINAGDKIITNVKAGTADDHAVNVSQLNKLADTPLIFAGDSGTNVERKLGETVGLKGGAVDAVDLTDGNIGVVANGTDTLEIKLNKDIDLGAGGSLAIGDTLVDYSGLTVDDGTGNSTEVGAGSIAVTDAAGTTTVAGNQIAVGGDHSIVISGDTGTIEGLTNTDLTAGDFATAGRAATEEQLDIVNETANKGWNVSTNGDATGENVAPGAKVDFSNADGNIVVDQTGTDLTFDLNKDLVLADDGSLTIGDALVNNDGLTVDDGTGNSTEVGAGSIAVTDAAGTTTVAGNQIAVGGDHSIVISGDTGTIEGLTNTDLTAGDFATAGRAATEEQLDIVNETANKGWNVSTNGDATGENVAPGAKVDFSNADGNIVVDQTGTDLTFDLNKDLVLADDGSLTIGDTVMNTDGVTVTTGNLGTTIGAGNIAVTNGTNNLVLNADKGTLTGLTNTSIGSSAPSDFATVGRAATEEQLNLSVSSTIDILGGGVTNNNGEVTGPFNVNGSDYDNVADAIKGEKTRFYSVNSTDETRGNYENDGATGTDAMAAGIDAEATGDRAVAMGTSASATGEQSTALGSAAQAFADSATAVGFGARADQYGAMAMGTSSGAHGKYSTAMGTDATANAEHATAVGSSALANAADSSAFGFAAHASAGSSTALGGSSIATEYGATAVGNGAQATHFGSVALGMDSSTDEAVATTGITLNGEDYAFAGAAPIATVSVGSAGNERTITNVAAGRISETSTDAINGSQLHATNTALTDINETVDKGLNFAGNTGADINRKLGETLGIKGGITDATVATSGENVITRTDADGNINIELAEDATFNSLTTGDTVMNTDGVTVTTGNLGTTIGAGSIAVTNGTTNLVLDADKGTLTGLTNTTLDGADFAQAGRAATEEQLQASSTELTNKGLKFEGNTGGEIHRDLGSKLNIVGGMTDMGEDAASATNIRTVANDQGELEIQLSKNLTDLETVSVDNSITIGDDITNQTIINKGNVITNNIKVGDDFYVDNSGAHYGGDITENTHIVNKEYVDQAGTDLTQKGLKFAGNDGVEIHRDLGSQLNVVGGMTDMDEDAASATNIRTVANNNGDLEIQLSKNLTDLESVTVGSGDKKVEIREDSLALMDAGNTNTSTAMGTTIADKDGNTNAMTAAGMVVTDVDTGASTDVGAGIITVAGGSNSIQIDGTAGTISGLSNQTTDYAGFADGSGRAATEEQLKDSSAGLVEKGLKFAGNDGEVLHRDLGSQLNVVGGMTDMDEDAASATNIRTVANNNGDLEIQLSKNLTDLESVTVDSDDIQTVIDEDGVTVADKAGNTTNVAATQITVGGDNPIVMNGNAGMITGLQNTNWSSPSFATAGRAATEEQLKPLGDFLGFKDGDYTFNYNGKDHDSLAGALDSIHWNVEAPEAGDNTGGNGTGSGNNSGSGNVTTTPISNTNTVGFAGDENISVSKTERKDAAGKVVGADIQVALEQDIKVNSITAVDVNATNVNATNVNTGSVNISNGGPVINSDGIDMSDKRITNVAAGVDAGDAVNVGQLEGVQNNIRNEIGGVRRDLHKVDRKLRAGVAAAMATAGLPQAYLPGKSMVGLAGGTWNGESGVALGVSKITDNGKWVIKVSGNASTRGDYGGTVGGGYQW